MDGMLDVNDSVARDADVDGMLDVNDSVAFTHQALRQSRQHPLALVKM